MSKTLSIYALVLAVTLLAVALFFNQSTPAIGSGWLGFQSHIQSATSTTVGPDEIITLFADEESATCHSRVITTTGSAIMISFDDVAGHGSTTISGEIGHWQDASTTVAYDSGQYGCGLLSAYGYSSSTVTISSF